jgi:hypothetical protein
VVVDGPRLERVSGGGMEMEVVEEAKRNGLRSGWGCLIGDGPRGLMALFRSVSGLRLSGLGLDHAPNYDTCISPSQSISSSLHLSISSSY